MFTHLFLVNNNENINNRLLQYKTIDLLYNFCTKTVVFCSEVLYI